MSTIKATFTVKRITAKFTLSGSGSGGSNYILPVASNTTLGGVKIGDVNTNITIDNDGVISAVGSGQYVLPTASTTVKGGIKVGDHLTIDADGSLNATQFDLPTASTTVKGGVKIGDGMTIDSNEKLTTVPAQRLISIGPLTRRTTGTDPDFFSNIWFGTTENTVYAGTDFTQVRYIKILDYTNSYTSVFRAMSGFSLLNINVGAGSGFTIKIISRTLSNLLGTDDLVTFFINPTSSLYLLQNIVDGLLVIGNYTVTFKPRAFDFVSAPDIVGKLYYSHIRISNTPSTGSLLQYNANDTNFIEWISNIGTSQIADDSITLAKINTTNTGTTNQFLQRSADGLLWANASGSGSQFDFGGREYHSEKANSRLTTGTDVSNQGEIWFGSNQSDNTVYTGSNWEDIRKIKFKKSSNIYAFLINNSVIQIFRSVISNAVFRLSSFTINDDDDGFTASFPATDVLYSIGSIPTISSQNTIDIFFKPRVNNLISNYDIIRGTIQPSNMNLGGTPTSGSLLTYNSGQSRFQYESAISSAQISDSSITASKIQDGAITDTEINGNLDDAQKRNFRLKIDASSQDTIDLNLPVFSELNSLRNKDFGFYNGDASNSPPTSNAGIIFAYDDDQRAVEIGSGVVWKRDKRTTVPTFSSLTVTETILPVITTLAQMRILQDNDVTSNTDFSGVARFTQFTTSVLTNGLVTANYVVARNGEYFIAVNGRNFYHAKRNGNNFENLTWHYKSYTDVIPNNLQRGDFDYLRAGFGWIIITLDEEDNKNISWIAIEQPDGDIRAFGILNNTFAGIERTLSHELGNWGRVQSDTNQIKDNAITLSKINASSGSANKYLQINSSNNGLVWSTVTGGGSTDDYGGRNLDKVTLTRLTSNVAPTNNNEIWFGTSDSAVYSETSVDGFSYIKIRDDVNSTTQGDLIVGSRIRISTSSTNYFIIKLRADSGDELTDTVQTENSVTSIKKFTVIYKSSGATLPTGSYTLEYKPSTYDLITNEDLEGDSIDTVQIKNGSITVDKIGEDAITEHKIANASVNYNQIKTNAQGTVDQVLAVASNNTLKWVDAGSGNLNSNLSNLDSNISDSIKDSIHEKLSIPLFNYRPKDIVLENIDGMRPNEIYQYNISNVSGIAFVTGSYTNNVLSAYIQTRFPNLSVGSYRLSSGLRTIGTHTTQATNNITNINNATNFRALGNTIGIVASDTPATLRPTGVTSTFSVARNGSYFLAVVGDDWYWANRPSDNNWTALTWNYKYNQTTDNVPQLPSDLVIYNDEDQLVRNGWVILNKKISVSNQNIYYLSNFDNSANAIYYFGRLTSNWAFSSRTVSITWGNWTSLKPSVPTAQTSISNDDQIVIYNSANTRNDSVTRDVLEENLNLYPIKKNTIVSGYQAFLSINNDITYDAGDVLLANPSGNIGYLLKIKPKDTNDQNKLTTILKLGYKLELSFGTNILTGDIVNITTNNNFEQIQYEINNYKISGTLPTLSAKSSNGQTGTTLNTIKSINRYIQNDAITQSVVNDTTKVVSASAIRNLQGGYVFETQSDNLTVGSGTGFTDFNFWTPPIQILDQSNTTIKIEGVGVLYCGTSIIANAIGCEFKSIYATSSSKTGTFSSNNDVPYTFRHSNATDNIFFRSKISAGGSDPNETDTQRNQDDRRFRDYSPSVSQVINATSINITDGHWVRFKLSVKKPASDFPDISSAYSWRVDVTLYRQ